MKGDEKSVSVIGVCRRHRQASRGNSAECGAWCGGDRKWGEGSAPWTHKLRRGRV
jgi:hypothetical protein